MLGRRSRTEKYIKSAREARGDFLVAKSTQIHLYVLLTYMSWFESAAGTTHLYVLGHISEYLLYNKSFLLHYKRSVVLIF